MGQLDLQSRAPRHVGAGSENKSSLRQRWLLDQQRWQHTTSSISEKHAASIASPSTAAEAWAVPSMSSTATPVYFELSWAILSSVSLVNVFIGILIVGITDVAGLSLLPIIVSGCGAVANGLCYYAFYGDYRTSNRVAGSVLADLFWLAQEAGLSFYSYQILLRLLRDRQRILFVVVFWIILFGVIVVRMFILVNRAKDIASGGTARQNFISRLHVGFFSGIALVECWSAFFLMRVFAAAHRNSTTVLYRSNIFRELTRSTEVRVASLCVIGVTRAVTYSFQTTPQSATSVAGQLDRFIYTLECMFPVVMMIDFISSKLSHSQAQNQERFENSRNNAKYIRPQNPRGGKLSNLSIRTQHDIEQHSFVLLEPPTASVRKSATKTVETTCKRAHQDV